MLKANFWLIAMACGCFQALQAMSNGSAVRSGIGAMMGAFIVAGLAFVAPKLGPTQTFILYFFVIAVMSALIDSFGLLGTEAKPLQARQLVGVLLAGVGLVLARS